MTLPFGVSIRTHAHEQRERALNTLEDLENALQQTTEGLYLGLEVLTGCTYYYKM